MADACFARSPPRDAGAAVGRRGEMDLGALSATRRLLCSQESMDDGFLLLEIVDENEELILGGKEVQNEGAEQEDDKTTRRRKRNALVTYMMDFWAYGHSGRKAGIPEELHDELREEGGTDFVEDKDDEQENETLSVASEFSDAEAPEVDECSSQHTTSHTRTSSSSSRLFSRTLGNLRLSVSSPSISTSTNSKHSPSNNKYFSFTVYSHKNKPVPESRSECNRVALDWLENMDPRGQKWEKLLAEHSGLFINFPAKTDATHIEEMVEIEQKEALMDQRPRLESADRSIGDDLASVQSVCSTTQSSSTADISCIELEIDRDVPRTYPTLAHFQNSDVRHQLRLNLRAAAHAFPEIGYVQGMNYVMAQLMLHFGENSCQVRPLEAFKVLMEKPAYSLQGLYAPGLAMLKSLVGLLRSILQRIRRPLLEKLKVLELDSLHFTYNWFLTLFSYTMPFEVLEKVWELFFIHGWEAIFRVSLALLVALEGELQKCNFEKATHALRAAPVFPPTNLIERAKKIRLTARDKADISDVLCMSFV